MREANKVKAMVIGVGNILFKDEGIGVHIIQALERMDININKISLELIDAGTTPDWHLFVHDKVEKLLIIDAVKAGGTPGTIYLFKPEALFKLEGEEISTHEFGLRQNLNIMQLSRRRPKEIVIIGVEPEDIGWGMELSPLLRSKIPEITEVVLKEAGVF